MNDSVLDLEPNPNGSSRNKQTESSLAMTEEDQVNDSNTSFTQENNTHNDSIDNQLGKDHQADAQHAGATRAIYYEDAGLNFVKVKDRPEMKP